LSRKIESLGRVESETGEANNWIHEGRPDHAMDLLSTHPIKTSDLGFHGNLFGSAVLAWMDASAVSYAMRHCAEPQMLTLSLEDCHFKKTVKEGEVLSLYGFPCHLGRSSIRIAVEARVLNLTTQKEWTVLCACLRFVCVDGQGKSKPISEAARERIAGMLGGRSVAAATGLGGMEGLNGWGI
jgi:acyl-CoA thioesterase YciA